MLVFSVTSLLINFGAMVFQPFIPLYLASVGADIPETSLVFVGIAIATNLMYIPGGILADRIGRKPIIVLGNVIGFGMFLALLGVNDWTMALVVLFGTTAFSTLVQPAYSAIVAESVKVKERVRAFGTLYVLVYLAWALGSVLGGFLPYAGRFQLNILVVAITGLVATLGRFVFLKETRQRKPSSAPVKSVSYSFLGHLTRNVWLVLIALLIFNFSSGLLVSIYAFFSTMELHLSTTEFGIMVGFGYLASMVGAFGVGRLSKKFGIRTIMILTVLLEGSLIVPWIYSPNLTFAFLFYALLGFFSPFFFVGNQTLMNNVSTPEERSSIIGFILMTAGLGSIISPYIGAELWVLLGPRIPFLVSAIIAVGVIIPLALVQESLFERD